MPIPVFDDMLTLAHTMHSTHNSHALLFGAGVSIAAGAPSAWEVITGLVGDLAAQAGQPRPGPDEAETWYVERFEVPLAYETLIEGLAPTQTERQRLLRRFFEPDPDDADAKVMRPSAAHRAVADLVKRRAVRIILTLNFDRLAETALQEVGIQPVILSSPADLAGLAPLHTIDALVVHLHGDYLSPMTMLNTVPELETYQSLVDTFLDEVFANYGLVAVGWSARYDTALRAAIARQARRVFTSYFINPGPLEPEAQQLIAGRQLKMVAATADDALGRLADNVAALDDRDARHPLTVSAAIGAAKRDLGGQSTAIALHDALRDEFERVRKLPDLDPIDRYSTDAEATRAGLSIQEGATVAAGLIAATAYWGNTHTDAWWIDEIFRFTYRIDGGGTTSILRLPMVAATLFLHAAGVSSIAARRFDLTHQILTEATVVTEAGPAEPAACLLDPAGTIGSLTIFDTLKPLFVDHLALGERPYEEAWETFDLLRRSAAALRGPSTRTLIAAIAHADQALTEVTRWPVDPTTGVPVPPDETESHRDAVRVAKDAADRARAEYAGKIRIDGLPHVRVQDRPDHDGWGAPIARRLLADPQHVPWRRVLLNGLDHTAITETIKAVSSRLGNLGADRSWSAGTGNQAGYHPYFWLDTRERPDH